MFDKVERQSFWSDCVNDSHRFGQPEGADVSLLFYSQSGCSFQYTRRNYSVALNRNTCRDILKQTGWDYSNNWISPYVVHSTKPTRSKTETQTPFTLLSSMTSWV